ncbi:hypothetical protein A4A49_65669 [Nicotiana attenuata]|nr:hypothetical protein A4A49_65669 [Nicotiana attenuata]
MRQFDPWPVFFRREWSRNWPFLVGFAVTGAIITKLSLGFTEEDRKNSKFAMRHKKHISVIGNYDFMFAKMTLLRGSVALVKLILYMLSLLLMEATLPERALFLSVYFLF